MQKDRPCFVFRSYTIKRVFNDYFIERGFLVKNEMEDKTALRFDVHGIPLVFHQVKPKKNVFLTTVDISKVDSLTEVFIKDTDKMYELLLLIAKKWNICDILGVRTPKMAKSPESP